MSDGVESRNLPVVFEDGQMLKFIHIHIHKSLVKWRNVVYDWKLFWLSICCPFYCILLVKNESENIWSRIWCTRFWLTSMWTKWLNFRILLSHMMDLHRFRYEKFIFVFSLKNKYKWQNIWKTWTFAFDSEFFEKLIRTGLYCDTKRINRHLWKETWYCINLWTKLLLQIQIRLKINTLSLY